MKTTIAVIATTLLVGSLHAQDGGSFRAEEFNISVFGGWVDKHDSTFAPGAGVSYFFTENFGAGAYLYMENYDRKFIDDASGEVYFRWPLHDLSIAPYGLGAFGYSFETEEWFGAIGAGAEYRFHDGLGVFSDIRYQFNADTDDGVGIRAGVRFVF